MTEIMTGRQALTDQWLAAIERQTLPIINRPEASCLINQARTTQQELVFVGIGCQDWQKVDDHTWHIGKITETNKRARRFAEEISQFQIAMSSLGVPAVVNLALSDVEIESPIIQAIDAEIDDRNWARENAAASQNTLANLIDSAGGQVNWFNHWSAVAANQFLASSYADFMAQLFRFDLTQTATAFVQSGQLGPIWLDCQSSSFNEIACLFSQVATQTNVPVLAPFANASNWHSRPKPKSHFSDIFELMQDFGFKPAANQEDWRQRSLKLPDPIILTTLKAFGNESLTAINDWDDRHKAIDWLMQIVFI